MNQPPPLVEMDSNNPAPPPTRRPGKLETPLVEPDYLKKSQRCFSTKTTLAGRPKVPANGASSSTIFGFRFFLEIFEHTFGILKLWISMRKGTPNRCLNCCTLQSSPFGILQYFGVLPPIHIFRSECVNVWSVCVVIATVLSIIGGFMLLGFTASFLCKITCPPHAVAFFEKHIFCLRSLSRELRSSNTDRFRIRTQRLNQYSRYQQRVPNCPGKNDRLLGVHFHFSSGSSLRPLRTHFRHWVQHDWKRALFLNRFPESFSN